jgi:hypothetical protein
MSKPRTVVAQVRVSGPLASCAAPYKAKLEASGYTAVSIAGKLRQLSRFSLWLEGQGVGLKGLDRQKVAQFVAVGRRERPRNRTLPGPSTWHCCSMP